MYKRQILAGPAHLTDPCTAQDPDPRQDCGAFGYYGYGLSMKQLDDLKVVEHGGSLPGVSSNIAWSNEAEAAVIVLCNTSGVPVRLISDALMRMYNGRNPVDRRDVWRCV